MRSILGWLAGRKTYLVSGALVCGVLLLVFLGLISPSTGVSTAVVAGFAFGFRALLEKHHDETLAFLFAIAEGGEAYRAHDKKALAAATETVVKDGAALGEELRTERES